MSEIRTGAAVGALVEAVQSDIGDGVADIRRGLDKLRALEAHARGINGLASTLRAKCKEVETAVDVLEEEAESVARKMMGEPKREITESVDADRVRVLAELRKADEATA